MRGNVPPAGVPRRQSLTNAESEAGNFLGHSHYRDRFCAGGSYGCGHSEVSDDDLITAAQRSLLHNDRCCTTITAARDHQAFVELCAQRSSPARRRYSGSFRVKRTRGRRTWERWKPILLRHWSSSRASSRSRRLAHLVGTRKAMSSQYPVRVYVKSSVAKRLGVSASYSLGLEEVVTSLATGEKL